MNQFQWQDGIRFRTRVTFGWLERLRVLVGSEIWVTTEVKTERLIGAVSAPETKVQVMGSVARWARRRRQSTEMSEAVWLGP